MHTTDARSPIPDSLKFIFALFLVFTLSLLLNLDLQYRGPLVQINQGFFNNLMRHSHMLSDWLFLQVSAQGINPYNHENLLGKAYLVGADGYYPAPRLSPPWYYLLFSPLAGLSSLHFTLITLLLSVFATVRSIELSFKLLRGRPCSVTVLLGASLFFAPLVDNLVAGQVGAFLLLLLLNAVNAYQKRNEKMVGFWLALLSIKPHSTYLCVCVLMAIALRDRRLSIILGYLATIAMLVVGTYILNQELFQWWITMSYPIFLKTFTAATYIRLALQSLNGNVSNTPIYLISGIAATIAIVMVFKNKIRSNRDFSLLLCFSVITAPYGWFYDLVILIPVNVFILIGIFGDVGLRKRLLFLAWGLLNIAGWYGLIFCNDYLSLWYLPVGLTFLAYFTHDSANPDKSILTQETGIADSLRGILSSPEPG